MKASVLLVALMLVSGCASPPPELFTERVAEVPAVTNGAAVIPSHTATNYAPRAEVVAIVEGIGAVTLQPWGAAGAAAAVAGLGLWAAIVNRRRNQPPKP